MALNQPSRTELADHIHSAIPLIEHFRNRGVPLGEFDDRQHPVNALERWLCETGRRVFHVQHGEEDNADRGREALRKAFSGGSRVRWPISYKDPADMPKMLLQKQP